jgi:hypothetical protein
MKKFWFDFKDYLTKKIWVANVVAIILSILIVIMYVFVPNQIEFEYSLIIYIIFALFTSFFLSYCGLLLLSVLEAVFKSENTYFKIFKYIFLFSYILFVLRFLIGFLMEFYAEDLGIAPEDYLSAMISLLSLAAAILIPIILTNVNRKDTEKLIRDQRENDAIPIFKFEKVSLFKGGYSQYNMENSKEQEVKLNIVMKNIVDRIAILYSCTFKSNTKLIKNNYIINDENVEFYIDIISEKDELLKLKVGEEYKIEFSCLFKNIYLKEYTQNFEAIITKNEHGIYRCDIGDYGPLTSSYK